jgi:hypothetical protein
MFILWPEFKICRYDVNDVNIYIYIYIFKKMPIVTPCTHLEALILNNDHERNIIYLILNWENLCPS